MLIRSSYLSAIHTILLPIFYLLLSLAIYVLLQELDDTVTSMARKSAWRFLPFRDSLVYSNEQDSKNKSFYLHQIGRMITFCLHNPLNPDTLHISHGDDDDFSDNKPQSFSWPFLSLFGSLSHYWVHFFAWLSSFITSFHDDRFVKKWLHLLKPYHNVMDQSLIKITYK